MTTLVSVAGIYTAVSFNHQLQGSTQSIFHHFSLNADGSFSNSAQRNADGVIGSGNGGGTYTVGADGSMSAQLTGGGNFAGHVGASGEFLLAQTGTYAPEVVIGVQALPAYAVLNAAGSYSFVNFNHQGTGPFQAIFGTLLLAADGSFTTTYTSNTDGTITANQSGSGSYALGANGSFSISLLSGPTLTGQMSANGQIVLAQVGATKPEFAVAIRNGGSFTMASVAGRYTVVDFAHQFTGQYQSAVGSLNLKADGTFTTSLNGTSNGQLDSAQISGTWTVSADGSLSFKSPEGAAITGHISATGELVLAQTSSAQGGDNAPEVMIGLRNDQLPSNLTLVGTANADAIGGGAGNDSLSGGGGNDVLTGGAGTDVASYSGALTDYQVTYSSASGIFTLTDKVAGRDGADQVSGIESFRFAGTSYSAAQLQALTNTDTTAPTVTGASPAGGAVGVVVGANIVITFSEAVGLSEGSITLRDADGNVVDKYGPGSSSLSISGNTLTINPLADLQPSTGYTLEISAGIIKDLAGNAYTGSSGYRFTTAGSGITQTATATNPNLTGTAGDDTLIAGPANGTLDGGAGNDVLVGGAGQTLMLGGAGNDTLISGSGADTLQGGNGADLYYVNDAGDVVQELQGNAAIPGEGPQADLGRTVDKVIASINYTLTSFVENLSLAPSAGGLSGIGNELNNLLAGNEGNNVLTGKAGNDTMDGGAGQDTAQYTGKLADYTLTVGGTATIVTDKITNRDGADSLSNIERLKFADAGLALDLGVNQAGGKAVLMMAVATSLGKDFVNLPSFAGLFLGFFDTGASLLDGANLLVGAGVIAAFAGGADNTSLVKMVYNDVYGKAPDAATLASLVAPLTAGSISQAQWLADMAASTANQQHVGLAGYAGTGLQFMV